MNPPLSGHDAPPRLRLFVAVSVPEVVRDRIASAQDLLRASLPHVAAKWTRPDQWHLTLKFLGSVEGAALGDLTSSLRRQVALFSSFEVTASDLGCFPTTGAPRVIWAGVQEATGVLARLQAAVEEALAPFTREKPEGRFSGHITLARVKSIHRSDVVRLQGAAKAWAGKSWGTWRVTQVELIRSELSSQGSRYTTLAQAALQ